MSPGYRRENLGLARGLGQAQDHGQARGLPLLRVMWVYGQPKVPVVCPAWAKTCYLKRDSGSSNDNRKETRAASAKSAVAA